jgi:hypothetical protein
MEKKKLGFRGGCKRTSKKGCNRLALQPKVQEVSILPLGAKLHSSQI